MNPNIARPEINSEILTIPSTGPTKIPQAISKTILGIFIFSASKGNRNAPKDIITSGITFGVDKKNSKNNFYGYAIRYADGKARLGSSGDTLMDSTTLNYYFITPFNDNGYSNMVLGLSSLKYKLQTQGTVTGNRNGEQIFTTIDDRKHSEFGSFNFTPSFKLKYAVTKLCTK